MHDYIMYIPLGKVDLYLDVSLGTKMVVNLAKLWLLKKETIKKCNTIRTKNKGRNNQDLQALKSKN